MVTHHTASLITAKACGRCHPVARRSRSVVSRIAVMDQSRAPDSAGGSLAFWRFHETRQRAEQNRACSRRGANVASHCSHFLVSVIAAHVTRNRRPGSGNTTRTVEKQWVSWRGGPRSIRPRAAGRGGG